MAKVKYVNKATGKSFTAEADDVAIIKANPVLKNRFTFEAEEAKPKDLKTKPAEEATK